MTLLDRIAAKVEISDSGCWLWIGTISRDGYGEISPGSRELGKAPAHRALYQLVVEEIPGDLVLDHLCRVRSCVNPDHLEPVTNRENLLRGEGLAALNARKTHCVRNHELAGDNLWLSRGQRQCRACKRIRQAKWKASKR